MGMGQKNSLDRTGTHRNRNVFKHIYSLLHTTVNQVFLSTNVQ